MTSRSSPAGGSWMGWVLRLVETGTDSRARSIDVLEISRPNDLGDIGNLGLTLPEAKQLLAHVQQAVVAVQAHDYAVLRPDCLRIPTMPSRHTEPEASTCSNLMPSTILR